MLTIVTPSFNQGRFIGEAINSVRSQGHTNWEHLVIDAQSTDNTLNVLQSLAMDRQDSCTQWISEPDKGQSEALNKGFRRAKGEIIGWLNADDRYRPGCFETIVKAFQDNPEVDILYGDYLLVNEAGNAITVRREIEFNRFILQYHHVLYIPTTSTFFRRRIFDEGNWLNEDLHYAMDLEFFIRLSSHGYRFKHVPELLADFRLQGESKTCKSSDKQRAEHRQVVLESTPLLHRIKPLFVKRVALRLLWSIACIRRYSEKLLRGYYWGNLHSPDSSLSGM
jgi:glycosyltransferase involved in cell wall biosynthesis